MVLFSKSPNRTSAILPSNFICSGEILIVRATISAVCLVRRKGEEKIDTIFSSPFLRTKQTAEIVARTINISPEQIKFDGRIAEVRFGDFENKTIDEFHKSFKKGIEQFTEAPEGGENFSEVKRRVGDFLSEIDTKFEGKTILVVTHEAPAWMIFTASLGLTPQRAESIWPDKSGFIKNGGVRKFEWLSLPRDKIGRAHV